MQEHRHHLETHTTTEVDHPRRRHPEITTRGTTDEAVITDTTGVSSNAITEEQEEQEDHLEDLQTEDPEMEMETTTMTMRRKVNTMTTVTEIGKHVEHM